MGIKIDDVEKMHPLERYLKFRNITYVEFAEMIGISEGAVSNYIKARRLPTLDIAIKIYDATKKKVTLNEMVEFYEQKKRKGQSYS